MRQMFTMRRHAGHEHDGGGSGVRTPGATATGQPMEGDIDVSRERLVDAHSLPALSGALAPDSVVYFDAPSGAGGDMIVAALVDLGVPWPVVADAVAHLHLDGVRLKLLRGTSGAVSGLRFVVEVNASVQFERSYRDIRVLLEAAALSPSLRRKCLLVFDRLARAEAKVHHVDVEEVHFHEVGAVDSIVDIVSACAALDYLGGQVRCSPLPMGRGFCTCRHGVIPLPAPATVECLIGLQTLDSGLEHELVTPTAAAVFGALGRSSGWPSGTIRAVGWGRGTLTLPDRPNLLRVVIVDQ